MKKKHLKKTIKHLRKQVLALQKNNQGLYDAIVRQDYLGKHGVQREGCPEGAGVNH